MFYKVARFVSLSVFVSDFGAVYLQSSTSHRGYKNLMAGENCLKAASCEPGVFVKTQASEDIIVGIIKGEIYRMHVYILDYYLGLTILYFACICIILLSPCSAVARSLSLTRIYNLSPLSQVVQAEPGAQ